MGQATIRRLAKEFGVATLCVHIVTTTGCGSFSSQPKHPLMVLSTAETSSVHTLNSRRDYDAFLSGADEPVCVMFKSPACGACREMLPHFKRVASRYSGKVVFAVVSLVEVDGVARDLRILGTPTTVVFWHGNEVGRFVGPMTDEGLCSLVESTR